MAFQNRTARKKSGTLKAVGRTFRIPLALSDALRLDPSILGYSLYEDYITAFGKHFFGDRLLAGATMHLLVGQLPNIRKLQIRRATGNYQDARIHVTFLSPSATGKGVAANFVERMSKQIGVKYSELDLLTTNALVGTVDKDTKEIERGLLDPASGVNIIAATEASTILTERPVREAQDVMNMLQKAMNPMGSSDATIGKKIGYGKRVEVKPECSVFLASFPPQHITEIVLGRGFLQRTILVARTVSAEDRARASDRKWEGYQKFVDTEAEEHSISMRLLHVNKHYAGYTHLPVSPEAVQILKDAAADMREVADTASPYLYEKLGEFVTRFEDILLKAALHFACLKLHSRIEGEDAFHATVDLSYTFKEIVSFLEMTIEPTKEYERRYSAMYDAILATLRSLKATPKYANRSHGWFVKRDVIKHMPKCARISLDTAHKYVKLLITYRLLEEREHETAGSIVRFRDPLSKDDKKNKPST